MAQLDIHIPKIMPVSPNKPNLSPLEWRAARVCSCAGYQSHCKHVSPQLQKSSLFSLKTETLGSNQALLEEAPVGQRQRQGPQGLPSREGALGLCTVPRRRAKGGTISLPLSAHPSREAPGFRHKFSASGCVGAGVGLECTHARPCNGIICWPFKSSSLTV